MWNRFRIVLTALALSVGLCSQAYSQDEALLEALSDDERAFLEERSTFRVTNEDDWPPFDYSEDGVAMGYSIDYMNLIAEKLGVEFEYINGYTWDELLAQVRAKEIDIAHTILKTPERSEYILFTEPYFVNPYVLAVRNDSPVQSIEDLNGKSVATVRSYVQYELLSEHYPEIEIVLVDSAEEQLRAVSFGQADAAIEAFGLVNYAMQQSFLTNLKVLGDIDDGIFTESAFRIGVRDDWPLLQSILQKAMKAISPEEETALKSKWFTKLAATAQAQLQLTPEEQEWLKRNGVIRFAGDPDWLPFEAFAENGNYVGIVADHLRLLEEMLGIRFEEVETDSWTESLDLAIQKKADVISGDAADSILSVEYDAIEPYISNPVVVITRDDEPFLTDIQTLRGRRLGVIEGNGYLGDIFTLYPEFEFTEVENVNEGLSKVSTGQLDALFCTIALGTYMMDELGYNNLHVAGQTDATMDLTLYVRNDWPLFSAILNKAVVSISPQDRREILRRWSSSDSVITRVDYTLLAQVGGVFAVFMALTLFWNRKMAREVAERKKAEEQLKESETQFRQLLESAPDGMIVSDQQGRVIMSNHQAQEMFGYSRVEFETLNVDSLVPDRFRSGHPGNRRKFFSDPAMREMGSSMELSAVRKDGGEFPVEISLSPVKRPDGVIVSAAVRDITERKRRERLSALNARVTEALTDCETMQEMLQACAETIVEQIDAALARIWIHNDKEHELLMMGSAGLYTHIDGPHGRVRVGDKKIGLIAERREIMTSNKIQEDPLLDDKEWARRENLEGFIGIPLTVGQRLMGVIAVFACFKFDKRTRETLNVIADNIGLAIARKLADEELREKEEKFRAIADYTNDWEWWLGEDGRLLWTNPVCERLTGYTQEECLRMPNFPAILLRHEDRMEIAECIKTAIRDRSSESDVTVSFVRKDGETVITSLSWQPIYDSQRNYLGLRAGVRDITERVAAEERIRKLSAAVENSPSAVIVTDVKGIIEYVNPRFEEVTGYSEAEVIGKKPNVISSGLQPLEFYKELWDTILSGRTWRGEFRNKKKNGDLYWDSASISPIRNEHGVITHFIETAEDVTVRKHAEEKLRENKQFLEGVINNSPALIFSKRASGEYIMVNTQWCERLGMNREYCIGKTDYDLFPREIAEQFHVNDKEVFDKKQPLEYEERVTENGEDVYYYTVKFPLLDDDGEPFALCGIANNITERKRMEEQLRRASVAAEEANRSKSAFLANMSHEIRTPLNAIIGFSQLLQQEDSITGEQKENLNIICRSGDHLLNLINDILDMSKIEAGRIQLHETNFDVHQMLNDLKSMFHLRAQERGLSLEFETGEEVPQFIRSDDKKLRQVIVNLVGNAVKFTEAGGVTVRAAYTPRNETAGVMRFEVEDTGVGIAKEEIGKLFSAFEQTESGVKSKQGTGLGLAISREFVKLMGGDIHVESEAGQGTNFIFDIIVHKVDQADASDSHDSHIRQRAKALKPGQQTKKILIVDDEENGRRLLKQKLEPFGFELNEAADGGEAVERAAEWKPDLIFMDIRMPVLNGMEATQQIKASPGGEGIKVVALTASIFEGERQRLFDAGCDEYIRKPYRDYEIVESIERLLGVEFIYEDHGIAATPDEAMKLLASIELDSPILVIDDYPMNRQVAAKQLSKFGFACELAEDGAEGLAMAKANDYALIFSDLSMPNMDGYEFARNYREWEEASGHAHVPVIAMSAHVLQEEAQRCRDCGMDDFIGKPVTIEGLAMKLTRWFYEIGIIGEQSGIDASDVSPVEESQDAVTTPDASAGAVESATSDTSPPVDLEQLKQILGEDDVEGCFEMLGYFAEDFDSLIESLGQAFGSEDRQAIRDVSHTAKGGAGNAAAFELAETMKQLQIKAFDASMDELSGLFEQAKRQYADVQKFIQAGSMEAPNP